MHTLLDVAGLDGAPDAVRLAVLVLASRTPSQTGVVEIRTSELGRWIGMSASYTASCVVPVLRRSGVVSVETAEGDYGQDGGLRCKVLPLWAAQDVVGHPLNLTKKEYATLQRLLEAVMAPGWTHRDGRVTPAGLIGTRTGRGAATDRLALLLLVLEARETGRVRQCGGTVDTKRGRTAATVARLLGCTASAGERVLERLEDRELVLRVRLKTGSGMLNRSRLMVPAVAAAHGRTAAADVQENRAEALEPEFSDPDVAAGPGEAPEEETEPQVSGVPVTGMAEVAEPDVAAALHTDHPHLVTPVGQVEVSCGFSGEGRGADGRRPERAGAREDATGPSMADGQAPAPSRPGRKTAGGGPGSALRAEKPTAAPSHSTSPAALGVWGRVARRLPLTCEVLQPLLPQPSSHQRRLLDRMLGGLLAEGDDDAMIAARLRQRLAPLATGDSQRPYRFRRDALAWALSIGLPLSPGGRTLVPCAVSGCPGRTWGRVTDLRIRCDECELAALARAEAAQARTALEAALQTPLPAPAPAPLAAGQPAPGETPVPNTPRGPGQVPAACTGTPPPSPSRDAATGTVPPTVREQIALLEQLDPAAGRTARRAAAIMYASESETEPGAARDQQRAWAASAWAALTDRYAAQLTAHYSALAPHEEAA